MLDVEWHQETAHEVKDTSMCSLCDQEFINQEYLDVHMQNKHIADTNSKVREDKEERNCQDKCPHCNFFGNRSTVEEHIVESHGVIICGECGETFENRKTCEDHININHRTKSVI